MSELELLKNARRPDVEVAADLKKDVQRAIEPLLDVLNKAAVDGFEVVFSIAPDPMGKINLTMLKISKTFS